MSEPARSIGAIFFAIGMALAANGLIHAAAPGDSSVLEGTWHFATFSDNLISNDPGVEGARLAIDENGNVSDGIWADSWDDSGEFSGGSLTIDTEGKVEGSITYAGDRTDTVNFNDFRLSPDKDVVFGLGRSNNVVWLTLVAKGGSGFAPSNLTGDWYFFGFWDETAPRTGSAGWTRAFVKVNASGAITNGNGIDSAGDTFAVNGSMTITDPGVVGLDVTVNSDHGTQSTISIDDLRMALNKNMIGGVFDEGEDVGIAIMAKVGTAYVTADLEGTWYAFSYEDRKGGHEPGWTLSFFTLNSSGTVTAGADVEDDGAMGAIASGSLSVGGDGLVSGTIAGEAVEDFRMDASKNFIAGVKSEPDDDRLITVIVKATSIPAGGSVGAILSTIHLLLDD